MTLLQYFQENDIEPQEYIDVIDRMNALAEKISAYEEAPNPDAEDDYEENKDYYADLEDVLADLEGEWELPDGSDMKQEEKTIREFLAAKG